MASDDSPRNSPDFLLWDAHATASLIRLGAPKDGAASDAVDSVDGSRVESAPVVPEDWVSADSAAAAAAAAAGSTGVARRTQRRSEPVFVDKSDLLRDAETSGKSKNRGTSSSDTPVGASGDLVLTASTAPGVVFTSASDLRSHFKSDWHRYNLRQKLKQRPPVTADEFERLIEDGFSSLSGSASSPSSPKTNSIGAVAGT